ncbi:MAG: FprA family A-type flavoprotein [Clostridiaceae bacterium]
MKNNLLLKDNIYWIGKIDDRKVPFHRLILEKGTTYNSYLFKTEKPTIIDTVDIMYSKEFVENLKEHINLEDLKYIVINHVEPDHAGALPALLNKAPNATIVTNAKAQELLNGMFKFYDKNYLIVKDGDSLDIGGKTLKFFETPYLHTEETMITYALEDKILFPCDIFSSHIATYDLFNDLSKDDIDEDFKVYYKLIMSPHRNYVKDMIGKIKNLKIEIIAPSHGFILRKNVEKYIKLYDSMSDIPTENSNKKALILYNSMTGNTGKIGGNIGEGLRGSNVDTTVLNLKSLSFEEIKEKVIESDLILIGSSTKYGDMIGNTEEILKEIIKLDLSDKYLAAFGSYGWSGEAIEIINDYLKKSNGKVFDTSYIIKVTSDNSIKLPLRISFYNDNEGKKLSIKTGKILGELLLK